MRQFMTPRKLEWKGNPNPKPKESAKKEKEPKSEKK
jgi:tryptophanyl-tRNA synthetase